MKTPTNKEKRFEKHLE